jgi:hypothetical protein
MAIPVVWPTGKTSDEITGKVGNKMRQVRTHTWAPDTSPKLKSLQDLSIRVNPEVTEEVMHHAGMWVDGGLHLHLHVCKSSIHRSSHPIPSLEFSPTNSPKNEGRLFVHSNPLEQVHIVYTSVTKLLLAKRLILLHILGATFGNVITVRGHRNVIMCKIEDHPRSRAVKAQRMKTVRSLVIHHQSMSQSLGWTG